MGQFGLSRDPLAWEYSSLNWWDVGKCRGIWEERVSRCLSLSGLRVQVGEFLKIKPEDTGHRSDLVTCDDLRSDFKVSMSHMVYEVESDAICFPNNHRLDGKVLSRWTTQMNFHEKTP